MALASGLTAVVNGALTVATARGWKSHHLFLLLPPLILLGIYGASITMTKIFMGLCALCTLLVTAESIEPPYALPTFRTHLHMASIVHVSGQNMSDCYAQQKV
ncbi:hypothetical protein CCP4SC76_1310003 [Gammaproteobacteria bacterium]